MATRFYTPCRIRSLLRSCRSCDGVQDVMEARTSRLIKPMSNMFAPPCYPFFRKIFSFSAASGLQPTQKARNTVLRGEMVQMSGTFLRPFGAPTPSILRLLKPRRNFWILSRPPFEVRSFGIGKFGSEMTCNIKAVFAGNSCFR